MTVTGPTGDAGRSARRRYVTTALLARTADAGGGVALALAATRREPPLPTSVIGLLVAALALPHLAGPVLARWLDASVDYRRLLAGAGLVYAIALGALSAGLAGGVPAVALAVPALSAGVVGPLLTGGLSSRLSDLVAPIAREQERARGWDAMTYGVAGFAGPMMVAPLAATTPATVPLLVLAALAGAAAVSVVALPRPRRRVSPTPPGTAAVARLLMVNGPLRRTAVLTMVAAFVQGAVAVAAVLSGEGDILGGAVLVAALGAGNLAGSVWATACPSSREAESRVIGWSLAQAVLLGCCAVVHPGIARVAAFALVGLTHAPLFTAALAVRSQHAPPQGRAQVFVWSAGLKVAASSAGAACGGASAGLGLRGTLAIGAAVLLGSATALWRRRRTTPW